MNGDLEQLGERIAEQAAHLDAAMHRLLADLRAFDQRGGWYVQGALSCAHWLSWRVGWERVTARERVRVANKLAEFPAIDDALRRGEVSYSKVRAMVRVATPTNEALLLDHARLVPFEALIDSQGHYELERYLVSYLSSGRDLLRLAAHRASRSPAVIVADPDYGSLPPYPVPGTMVFRPLSGARAEAADLGRYFSSLPVTNKKATKEALAALVGPAVLHVATHGFYTRDQDTTRAPGSRAPAAPPPTASAPPASRGIYVELDGGMSSLSPPPWSSDPTEALDWSGLAMAGANQGAGGIVTAREIAGFDWWGTQLVVLSACQTGVGTVASGDGVYGLRRALVLAGAESQVVSLWNVNDSSARVLMRDYDDELRRGTGRAEALRQAKLNMLHQPRYAHPYYWAAFITAGDWRPLAKNTIRP